MASGVDRPTSTHPTEDARSASGRSRHLNDAVGSLFSQFLAEVVDAPVRFGGRKVGHTMHAHQHARFACTRSRVNERTWQRGVLDIGAMV
jgi:hypothetical protein